MSTPVSRPPVSRPPGDGAGPPAPAPAGPRPGRRAGGGLPARLRQLAWASVPIWSASLLSFAPFLRIALARRRPADWAVFAGYLAAVIVTVTLMSVAGLGEAAADAGSMLAVVVMSAAAVHACVAFRPGARATDAPSAPGARRVPRHRETTLGVR